VNDYIDARALQRQRRHVGLHQRQPDGHTGFVYLQFANQDARLHGFDLSGFADLGKQCAVGPVHPERHAQLRATARTAPRATTSTTSCR
jgi:hypothetical protein